MKYIINTAADLLTRQYIFSETGKVGEDCIVDKVVMVVSFDSYQIFPWAILGDAYPNPFFLDPKSSWSVEEWVPNANIVLRQVVGRYLIGERIS